MWWHGVDLVINYWLQGLTDGYNDKKPDNKRDYFDFYLLNSQGDMDDLDYFANREQMNYRKRLGLQHHCSGSVRITSDRKDVFFSQDTWTSFYSGFMRIAKTYLFNFGFNQTQNQQVLFSSYPGYFFSIDDLYVIHNQDKQGNQNNLAVLETTFHTFNTSLYDEYLDPEGKSVLTWTRVQLSNLFSFDQNQWIKSFLNNCSWTYNNNYLLLDYNMLQHVIDACSNCNGQEIEEYILKNKIELLKTLEVVPGHPKDWDATPALLDQGYYMSFNTPIDDDLYRISGYEKENEEDGTGYWSYKDGARKCITDKYIGSVETIDQFKEFVRYNDWKHEECQKGDSGQAIASRYDQRDPAYTDRAASLFGCTDQKVVSLSLAQNFEFQFSVGPISGGPSEIPKWRFSDHVDERKPPLGVHDELPSVWALVSGNDENHDDEDDDDANVVVVVCSIVIPCVCIALGIGIWALVFYKKGGYNRVQLQEPPKEEEANLIADVEERA